MVVILDQVLDCFDRERKTINQLVLPEIRTIVSFVFEKKLLPSFNIEGQWGYNEFQNCFSDKRIAGRVKSTRLRT